MVINLPDKKVIKNTNISQKKSVVKSMLNTNPKAERVKGKVLAKYGKDGMTQGSYYLTEELKLAISRKSEKLKLLQEQSDYSQVVRNALEIYLEKELEEIQVLKKSL